MKEKKDLTMEEKIPTLWFDTELEFQQALIDHEDSIYERLYYGVKEVLDYDIDEDHIILAYLNEDKLAFGSPREVWVDNLEAALNFFEEVENYDMCSKIVKLLKRMKDEQDE